MITISLQPQTNSVPSANYYCALKPWNLKGEPIQGTSSPLLPTYTVNFSILKPPSPLQLRGLLAQTSSISCLQTQWQLRKVHACGPCFRRTLLGNGTTATAQLMRGEQGFSPLLFLSQPELLTGSFTYTALLPHYGYSWLLPPTPTPRTSEVRTEASQELCSTKNQHLPSEGTRNPSPD